MKNKYMTKLLAAAMALTVALTAVPVTVQAAPSYSKNQTVYMSSSDYGSAGISVSNLTKSQTIAKSSVKSSNTAVVKPNYLARSTSSYSYKSEYFESRDPYSYSSNSYSYTIGVQLLKKGTATVSFKINKISATQTVKLTVEAYSNPVKSIKISGVSGDLYKKTAKSNYVSNIRLKSTKKNATIKVSANSGWKISSVELYDTTKDKTTRAYSYSKPVSSDTLYVGTLTGGKKYKVEVAFINTSNDATMYCYYYINQN